MRNACVALLLAVSVPAQGQVPTGGQPDNAAIMRAIEGLSGDMKNEMKALRGRVEQLEERERERERRQSANPRPATPPRAVAVPNTPARPAQAVPGWFVRLIPWAPDGGTEPVAGFPGPMHEFNFDMHTRYMPDNNRYTYNGIGILHIKEDGVYGFNMTLEPVLAGDPINIYNSLWFNCTGDFYVGGNRLFGGTTAFGAQQRPERDVYRSQNFFGQIRLTPGTHRLEFKTDCGMSPERNAAVFDKWLPVYKRNRFKVMIKSPSDTSPRPFRPEELYYVGQPN